MSNKSINTQNSQKLIGVKIYTLKHYVIGFILGLFFVGTFSYAAGGSSGTIGDLFRFLSGPNLENSHPVNNVYRLDGKNIKDETVTEYELANNSVTSNKIAVDSVTSTKIVNNSIGSSKIIDNSVEGADVLENTITEREISDSFKARDSFSSDNSGNSNTATNAFMLEGKNTETVLSGDNNKIPTSKAVWDYIASKITPEPPVCTGTNKALQWDGTSFICETISASSLASTNPSCFATSGGTITNYYNYENNNSLNPRCSRDVVIPSSIGGTDITSIGNRAFEAKGLTSVTIPDTVTTIGEWSFNGNYLTSVNIGSSVTNIGWASFRQNRLTNIVIPDSVTTIGRSSFAINNLTTAVISNSATHIGNHAFNRNYLTNVIIPNSVTTIGWAAFANNRLTSVTISNSLTSMGYQAFYNNRLVSVIIPSSLTSMGWQAFYFNRLTTVNIPNVNAKCYNTRAGTWGSTSLSWFRAYCFGSGVNITRNP